MQSLSSFMNTIRFNFLYIDKYSFGRTWTYPESAIPYNMLRYIIDGSAEFVKLFSLPADAPCAEAVDTADGSWKRTVSSKGAGGVTALCPVESRLYLGLAGSEKVRSANL